MYYLYSMKTTTNIIKTTDIKGNHAGYSESFGTGQKQIFIYKDLTDKQWRVQWNWRLHEMPFEYKQDAVDFINKLINKQ